MSTIIRPELSRKNKYWISKHRYYELKHFCMQYPEWKKQVLYLESKIEKTNSIITVTKEETNDYICEFVSEIVELKRKIELVEKAAKESDDFLGIYILKAVTEGLSFTYLKTRLDIPCEKDMYYDRYHKFFWILDSL